MEESVELLDGCWLLSSVGEDFVEESQSLSLLKVSVSIVIILVEDVHHHDLDILIFLDWYVAVVLDEEGAFLLGDDTITVEVDVSK